MTGLGICHIRPSSPPGAVSWAMAKPCVGCSLTTASTVHSGSDNVGAVLMGPSLEEPAPGPGRPGLPRACGGPAPGDAGDGSRCAGGGAATVKPVTASVP